jgi:tight adherence protein B
MNSEAAEIRQYAQLAKAGHRIHFSENQFTPATQKDLDRLLEITKNVGGQIAPTLDRFATVLNSLEQSRSELALAVAGPKASSRLVMSLPILVFVGAGISGIPIFQALAKPSIVWLSLCLGGLMFWLGSRWTNRLLVKSTPEAKDSGFHLEALAIAVRAGLPLGAAVGELARLLGEVPLVELPPDSATSGIGLADLLEEQANLVRFEQFTADRLRIQKTSVSVLWPLGLTVLPAFVLIAIVPVGAALIQNNL